MNTSGQFDVKYFLKEYSYPFKVNQDYITFPAIWRGGKDITSVAYYTKENHCIDFVTAEHFDGKELISRIIGKKDDELKEYINKSNITFPSFQEVEIKQQKIFDIKLLDKITPIYDYWINRGIDTNILKELKSGVFSGKGRFNGKYTFPIPNSKNQLIGLTARAMDNSEIRWMHAGQKSNWIWPAFTNILDIKNKNSVILVEGPGDLLSLMTCGIRNVIVLFGTDVSFPIINFLIKLNIGSIIISTNSDEPGKNASEKIYRKLNKYFNSNQIKILLPNGEEDWNDILQKSGKVEIIKQWNKI